MPAAAARAASRTIPTARAACGSRSRSTRSRQRASDMLGHDAGDQADRPGRQGGQAALHRGRLRHRPRALLVAAARPRSSAGISSSPRPRAAWTSRRWRTTPGEDRQACDRSGRRASRPFHGRKLAFGLGLERQAGRQVRGAASRRSTSAFVELDASLVEINPLVVTGDGERDRARRQDELRRQRALPPQGPRRAARPRRGGSARDRGRQVRPELHQARRQHRLHGQRRRPRHGDHGHHQAPRRRAGQLPRRRRRRDRGAGDRGVQDHPLRPERRRRSWSTSSAASCAAT